MTSARPISIALSTTLSIALGASAATAQPEEAGAVGASEVTGTSTLVGELAPGERTVADGVMQLRGNVLLTVEEASDPRVSGRATIRLDVDTYPGADAGAPPSQIRYGLMRIENADGAWAGSFAGRLSHGVFVQTYWLAGEGGYTGLSYVVTAGGNGPVWRSQGVIFPGDVPPLGGASLPRLDRLGPGRPSAEAPAP